MVLLALCPMQGLSLNFAVVIVILFALYNDIGINFTKISLPIRLPMFSDAKSILIKKIFVCIYCMGKFS